MNDVFTNIVLQFLVAINLSIWIPLPTNMTTNIWSNTTCAELYSELNGTDKALAVTKSLMKKKQSFDFPKYSHLFGFHRLRPVRKVGCSPSRLDERLWTPERMKLFV